MESIAVFLIPALLGCILFRLLLLPIKGAVKLGLHSGCGFLCLWLLNAVSGVTGIYFPINAVTVLTAGFLGIPGVGLLAILAAF